MCVMVGADYDTINFKDEEDPFYLKHEWPEADEEEFKVWISNFLFKSKKDFRSISRLMMNTRHNCDKVASEFIFMYGWKTKVS